MTRSMSEPSSPDWSMITQVISQIICDPSRYRSIERPDPDPTGALCASESRELIRPDRSRAHPAYTVYKARVMSGSMSDQSSPDWSMINQVIIQIICDPSRYRSIKRPDPDPTGALCASESRELIRPDRSRAHPAHNVYKARVMSGSMSDQSSPHWSMINQVINHSICDPSSNRSPEQAARVSSH